MFDKTMEILLGKNSTGHPYGMIVGASTRKIKLKFGSSFELVDWVTSILESISRNPYCKLNPFISFAPPRIKNQAKWYINAENYYQDIAQDIKSAKREIFITDWWMCPHIYLKRPMPLDESGKIVKEFEKEWRLDHILKEAAERNVKIFILLYREIE